VPSPTIARARDLRRTMTDAEPALCWRVVRVWNTEVLANPAGVQEVVLAALREAGTPSP
jgi:very-short-patch-repair endonuclease